jgi:hypothetical protein
MALRHDRKISVKLLAAAQLLRRVEKDGVAKVFPSVVEKAETTTSESEIVTMFVDIVDGDAVAREVAIDAAADDELPPSAYAFVLSIPARDGRVTDSDTAAAIVQAIGDLSRVYDLQGDL